jgi:hypothetical protein
MISDKCDVTGMGDLDPQDRDALSRRTREILHQERRKRMIPDFEQFFESLFGITFCPPHLQTLLKLVTI